MITSGRTLLGHVPAVTHECSCVAEQLILLLGVVGTRADDVVEDFLGVHLEPERDGCDGQNLHLPINTVPFWLTFLQWPPTFGDGKYLRCNSMPLVFNDEAKIKNRNSTYLPCPRKLLSPLLRPGPEAAEQ